VVDPHVTDWTRTKVLGLEELAGQVGRFPLTVVVTNHDEFDFAKLASQAQLILDCRNSVQPSDRVVAL
jgi:UDP-N-acetyl-D-mannosaminuronate dehydrogenase